MCKDRLKAIACQVSAANLLWNIGVAAAQTPEELCSSPGVIEKVQSALTQRWMSINSNDPSASASASNPVVENVHARSNLGVISKTITCRADAQVSAKGDKQTLTQTLRYDVDAGTREVTVNKNSVDSVHENFMRKVLAAVRQAEEVTAKPLCSDEAIVAMAQAQLEKHIASIAQTDNFKVVIRKPLFFAMERPIRQGPTIATCRSGVILTINGRTEIIEENALGFSVSIDSTRQVKVERDQAMGTIRRFDNQIKRNESAATKSTKPQGKVIVLP